MFSQLLLALTGLSAILLHGFMWCSEQLIARRDTQLLSGHELKTQARFSEAGFLLASFNPPLWRGQLWRTSYIDQSVTVCNKGW